VLFNKYVDNLFYYEVQIWLRQKTEESKGHHAHN